MQHTQTHNSGRRQATQKNTENKARAPKAWQERVTRTYSYLRCSPQSSITAAMHRAYRISSALVHGRSVKFTTETVPTWANVAVQIFGGSFTRRGIIFQAMSASHYHTQHSHRCRWIICCITDATLLHHADSLQKMTLHCWIHVARRAPRCWQCSR